MAQMFKGKTIRLDASRIQIPMTYKPQMKVPGVIFCSASIEQKLFSDGALEQVANVATLPGIVKASFAMPDIHWGYGFPIGGVAAYDELDGIISPGGVGYDINCGVRLIRTDFLAKDMKKYVVQIVSKLFENIPSGVGSEGRLKVQNSDVSDVLYEGASWAVRKGYGTQDDLNHTEDFGQMTGAKPDMVSREAIKRGAPQLGTLGAGNHFIEVQEVVEVYDEEIAKVFGLFSGQITIMIHTGSRGLGHQVATDYIDLMQNAARMYGIALLDSQLACAPFNSPEGQRYFGAMSASANYAWANRQVITHWIRESFTQVTNIPFDKLNMKVVYDIAHNIAKREIHDGQKVIVHRKGATRAFPSGYQGLPNSYKDTGHPVLVPGDMGRYSFVMVGTKQGSTEVFASSCHGAGRLLSRNQAIKNYTASQLYQELNAQGITVKAKSSETLTEEAPGAYKDVAQVVDVLHDAGIAKKVAKMKPIGVVKG